jgi:hypothetical protein
MLLRKSITILSAIAINLHGRVVKESQDGGASAAQQVKYWK